MEYKSVQMRVRCGNEISFGFENGIVVTKPRTAEISKFIARRVHTQNGIQLNPQLRSYASGPIADRGCIRIMVFIILQTRNADGREQRVIRGKQ